MVKGRGSSVVERGELGEEIVHVLRGEETGQRKGRRKKRGRKSRKVSLMRRGDKV